MSTRACIACGAKVPTKDAPPYGDHVSGCALVSDWMHEDRLHEATGSLEADLKRTRAMIEHLTAIIRAQESRERQRLVEVATKQREACARRASVAVDSDSHAQYLEGEVLATPLVVDPQNAPCEKPE